MSHDVRSAVARFHRNFSEGHVERNGEISAADVEVNSNGVEVRGPDAFVERLRRYDAPFPGLQLVDRLIIVEGSSAAVLYYLQGVHGGHYAGVPGTGRLIEATSAEFFDLDDDGLLRNLKTITRLDHVEAQVHGEREVAGHTRIDLQPASTLEPGEAEELRRAAMSLYRSDPEARAAAASQVLPADARVDVDGTFGQGAQPWLAYWDNWQTAFPDLTVDVQRVLQEGRRVAVGYQVRGTHDGVHHPASGDPLPPTGNRAEVDVIDFLELGPDGQALEIISVHNTADVRTQVVG